MPSRVKVGRGGGELRGERREGSGEMREGETGRGGRSAQDAPSVGRAREDNALALRKERVSYCRDASLRGEQGELHETAS